jgi:hypothetical protein
LSRNQSKFGTPILGFGLCLKIDKSWNGWTAQQLPKVIFFLIFGCFSHYKIIGKNFSLCELNLAWAQFEAGAVDIVCHLLPPSIRRLNIAGPKTQITDESIEFNQ